MPEFIFSVRNSRRWPQKGQKAVYINAPLMKLHYSLGFHKFNDWLKGKKHASSIVLAQCEKWEAAMLFYVDIDEIKT